MHVRLISIAVATAMTANAFAAEPAKPLPQPPAQVQQLPNVVLASAEQQPAPASGDQPAATPKPHRIARVTTCRCGDQQAQPDDEQK